MQHLGQFKWCPSTKVSTLAANQIYLIKEESLWSFCNSMKFVFHSKRKVVRFSISAIQTKMMPMKSVVLWCFCGISLGTLAANHEKKDMEISLISSPKLLVAANVSSWDCLSFHSNFQAVADTPPLWQLRWAPTLEHIHIHPMTPCKIIRHGYRMAGWNIIRHSLSLHFSFF